MTTDSRPTVKGLAQVLRNGRRDRYAREQTEPFLQQIGQAFVAEVPGMQTSIHSQRQGGFDPKSDNIQFINNIYFHISDHVDYLGLRVNFWPTGVLWWGLYAWRDEAHADTFAKLCRRYKLAPPGFRSRTGTGVFRNVQAWQGGVYCGLGRQLYPDEIARYGDVQSLSGEIAGDLIQLYRRIEPHLPAIWQALQVKPPPRKPGQRGGIGLDAKPVLPAEAEAVLAQIAQTAGDAEIEAAQEIVRWAVAEADGVLWRPDITPMVSAGTNHLLLFSLRVNGTVRLLFRNYAAVSPFDSQEARLDLCERLNRVSALNLSPADMERNVTMPLSALVDADERKAFLAAFAWLVAQVGSHSS
jgi:hypothetical protein